MERIPHFGALWVLVAVLVVLVPVRARAQLLNDHHYPVGHRAAGMGGAAVALSGDAAIAFYNPAGLGYLASQTFNASVTGYGLMRLDVPQMVKLSGEGNQVDVSGSGGSYALNTFPTSFAYASAVAEANGARHVIAAQLAVPDLEDYRFSASLVSEQPALDWSFEQHSTVRNYWLGVAYGMGREKIALGLAVYFPLLVADQTTSESYATRETLISHFRDYWSYSLALATVAGIQVRPSRSWRLGVSFTSPSNEIGHWGRYRAELIRSTPEEKRWVRYRSEKFRVRERQPWRARLGVAFERERRFSAALDLSVYGPVRRYYRIPRFKAQRVDNESFREERVHIAAQDEIRRVVTPQLNAGCEIWLTRAVPLRVGAFTNWSSALSLGDEEAFVPLRDDEEVSTEAPRAPPRLQGGGGVLGIGLVQEDQRSWFLAVSVSYLVGEVHGIVIEDIETLETRPFGTGASALVGVVHIAGTFEITRFPKAVKAAREGD